MKEIERKYLLKDSITSLIEKYALKKHKITQFYTIITPLKGVRYRQMDDNPLTTMYTNCVCRLLTKFKTHSPTGRKYDTNVF
jgi:hypothetical protein